MAEPRWITRRDFLKTSAGAVITAAGVSFYPSAARAAISQPLDQESILEFNWDFVPQPDFWFMVISDTHITSNPKPWIIENLFLPSDARQSWQKGAAMNIGRLLKIIHQANASKPALVLHLGDITTSHPQRPNWDKECLNSQELMGMFKTPVHLCPGNHDIGNKLSAAFPTWPKSAGDPRKSFYISDDNIALYEHYFGKSYYSFNHSDAHFIVLCEHMFGSGWDREAKQWQWLEADLAANKNARHIFMGFHTPIYWVDPVKDIGPRNYEVIDEEPRARLLDLIKKYNVRAVFTGHIHHNLTNQYASTGLFSVTSTAFARNSWSLYPDVKGGFRDPAHAGYLIVRVYGDDVIVNFVRTVDRLPDAAPPQPSVKSAPKRLITLRSADKKHAPLAVTAPLPYVVPRMWGEENVVDGRLKGPDGRGGQFAGWTSELVAAENANQWIQLDFQTSVTLTKVLLVARKGAFPLDFKIDLRRAGEWRTFREEKDSPEPDPRQTLEFPVQNQPADALRIVGTRLRPQEGRGRGYMSIMEIEAYDTDGINVALATRGTRVSSSSKAGRPGIHSNDNAWAAAFDTGALLVRVAPDRVGWEDIEPHKGTYIIPEYAKRCLAMGRAQGAQIVFPVTMNHPAYSKDEIPGAFKAYISTLVQSLADYVDGFELHADGGDPAHTIDCLRWLSGKARDRAKVTTLISGIHASAPRVREAMEAVGGPLTISLAADTRLETIRNLVAKWPQPGRFLVELPAADPIFERASAEAASRRFVEVVSVGGIPCATISGKGGLTDHHDDPGTAYYALRALASALAGIVAGKRIALTKEDPQLSSLAFRDASGDLTAAVWSQRPDETAHRKDIQVPGKFSRAILLDPLSSTADECTVEAVGDITTVRSLEIRRYPLIIRLHA